MKPTEVVKNQMAETIKHHNLEMRIAKILEAEGFEITRLSVSEEMTTEYGGPKMGLHIHAYSNRMQAYPERPDGWPI